MDAAPPVRVEVCGEDRPTGVRSLPVRADQEVELAGGAVGEVRDDLLPVLFEAVHAHAEDVLGVVLSGVVQDAYQVTAHDLVLGREALPAAAGGVGHDRRLGPAARVDEGDTRLVHQLAADGVQKPHPLDGLDALPAEVDLRPGGPQRRKAFSDGHPVAAPREPESQRLACYPAMRQQGPSGGALPIRRPCPPPQKIYQ